MKLRRLHIARLPGIDEPYTLEDVGDGFLLVVGPNGIGKSSLCRATRALLWAEGGSAAQVNVSALFEHEGKRWSVERDGSRHRWQKNGLDSEPPPLPAAHLRRHKSAQVHGHGQGCREDELHSSQSCPHC